MRYSQASPISSAVVAVGAVFGEVEGFVFEDGDEVGEAVHLVFAVAEFGGVVEVRHVGQFVGLDERGDDLSLVASDHSRSFGRQLWSGRSFPAQRLAAPYPD